MANYHIIETTPDGDQRVIFDGQTTKARAIGRARMYHDATIPQPGASLYVFRARNERATLGRLVYTLHRREQ